MGSPDNSADVLSDPLWLAAVPLAAAAAGLIADDLGFRRAALTTWRALCLSAPRGVLDSEALERAKAADELGPYPQARALLTKLIKEWPSSDLVAVERTLSKHNTVITEDFRAREAAYRLWTRLHRAMEEGRLQIAHRILGDPRMEATPKLYPVLAQRHHRVSIAVRRALDRGLTVLKDAIVEYAVAQGWGVTVAERRLVIDHLVAVELAEDRTTRVQATRVRSLSWAAVRPVLDSEYERVWGRARRSISGFVQELNEYLATRPGDNVRLKDVYDALKETRPALPGRLASYYRDEFSADLSVLLASNAGRRFEFSAIRDPRLAFTVVQPGGSLQQYGFIRLRGD